MKHAFYKFLYSTGLLAGALGGFSDLSFAISRDGARLAATSVTNCTSGGGTLYTTSSTYTCYDRVGYESGIELRDLNDNSDVVGGTVAYNGFPGSGPGRAVLFPGGTQTMVDLGIDGKATAISEEGVIAGIKATLGNDGYYINNKAFIYQNGNISEIHSSHTQLDYFNINAINSRGDVVGEYSMRSPSQTTFCSRSLFIRKEANGQYVHIDLEPRACSDESWGSSISGFADVNNRGFIVGALNDWGIKLNMNELFPEDIFPSLWDFGYQRAIPLGINESNDVVGRVVASQDLYYNSMGIPAIWRAGQLETLTFPGGGTGMATDINNNGEVVGQQNLVPNEWNSNRAFIHKDGQMRTLDELLCDGTISNSHLVEALKINNRGEILAKRESQLDWYTTSSYELLRPRTITSSGGGGIGGSGDTCYPQ